MSAQPVHESDPDDPDEILRVLPVPSAAFDALLQRAVTSPSSPGCDASETIRIFDITWIG